MAGDAQPRSYMPPGGMNDSVAPANLDPKYNQAPLIWNGEFDEKRALSKRKGSLRVLMLEEVDNPTTAPTLVAV